MYAVVRHYSTPPDAVEAMISAVDDEFADRVPQEVGAALYTAVDTGGGTATTITVYADEQAAVRSEAAVAALQQNLGERFGVKEIAAHRGEVVVSRASDAIARPVRFRGQLSPTEPGGLASPP
ncbi:hypothetical protein [Nonomuraea gerenzanensis]|uniref:ABM domain-containing protein n=1 Tax=Nonomuraea gerenzanensis TaxID=93944 RepID=A0A1M4E7S3_9ACTN|nr:hypothetical protein [Nonomuraea gerenzanensis]UBU17097.1 hypothetical protein LCN96_19385 [Nonomuraea gerenzanensis]SBO94832.1 hypothetical protein BN4615_P4348 [Nonomuraea gerenzanensis]